MSDRYAGRPFLRMLDGYVLDAIGRLDADEDAALTGLEAEVRRTYGVAGAWRAIVAEQMRFPAGMPGAIAELWDKGRAKFAEYQGHDPDPAEFARQFVDTRFSHGTNGKAA